MHTKREKMRFGARKSRKIAQGAILTSRERLSELLPLCVPGIIRAEGARKHLKEPSVKSTIYTINIILSVQYTIDTQKE